MTELIDRDSRQRARPSDAAPVVAVHPPAGTGVVFLVTALGAFMASLDATVVNVALPTIQRDLHFSQSSLAWVINAYLITFGGLLLLAGRLGDLLGSKRIFVTGLTVFVSASALCGFSQSQTELIVAGFVQGAGVP